MADFPAEGWGFPGNSRKAHYFPEGELTSLCGSWGFYRGDRQPDTHRSPDDCVRCRRERIKQSAAALARAEAGG